MKRYLSLIPFMRQHEFLFGCRAFAAEDFVAMRGAAEWVDYLLVMEGEHGCLLIPERFEKPHGFFLDFL